MGFSSPLPHFCHSSGTTMPGSMQLPGPPSPGAGLAVNFQWLCAGRWGRGQQLEAAALSPGSCAVSVAGPRQQIGSSVPACGGQGAALTSQATANSSCSAWVSRFPLSSKARREVHPQRC